MNAFRATLGTLVVLACGLAIAVASCEKDGTSSESEEPRGGPSAEEARAVASEGVVAAGPGGDDFGGPPGEPGGKAIAGQDPEPTPEIDRETYTVRVEAPSKTTGGEEGVAEVHVVPKEGWRMNHDFPMRLVVDAPDGVQVEGAEQEIEDAVHYSDERGEWAVGFTPGGAGEKTFEADFRFAVCTDAVCIPKREQLAWIVDVE